MRSFAAIEYVYDLDVRSLHNAPRDLSFDMHVSFELKHNMSHLSDFGLEPPG